MGKWVRSLIILVVSLSWGPVLGSEGGTAAPISVNVEIEARIDQWQDLGNVLATDVLASDGYDPGIDQPEPAPPPSHFISAFFPHPDWPLGPRFARDVRSDLTESQPEKVWLFRVETDRIGTVVLDFNILLPDPHLHELYITDVKSGRRQDLLDQAQVSFPSAGGTRDFELTLRRFHPAVFNVGVTVRGAGLVDTDNLAGTDPAASDGYDGGRDVPKPGPPPSEYLQAYFDHPDWPLGFRYLRDMRRPYRTDVESQSWPLVVETDRTGAIVLEFAPSFAALDGIGLRLHDLQTGLVHDLYPSLTFAFTSSAAGDYRFALLIGSVQALPPLTPGQREVPAGWSLLAVPLVPDPGADNVHDVLLSQAPPGTEVLAHRPGFGPFPVPAYARVEPGLGVWVGTDEPFTWTMAGNRDPDPVEIGLARGWNLVGYPLWFPGAVDRIQVLRGGQTLYFMDAAQAGWVHPEVYDFLTAENRFVPTDLLRAWHGYWVAALVPGVSLQFDYRQFIVTPAVVEPAAKSASALPAWLPELQAPDKVLAGDGPAKETPTVESMINAFPNPFNPTISLSFGLDQTAEVAIEIHDLKGRRVRILAAGTLGQGEHVMAWDGRNDRGRDLPSGIYLAHILIDGRAQGSFAKLSLVR